ncbi:MAG TPA: sortase [Caldilineaceae bacterium]|nr:sortase [Caldilineaceae bacterium]
MSRFKYICILSLALLLPALTGCRVVALPFQWPSSFQTAQAEPTAEVTLETADLVGEDDEGIAPNEAAAPMSLEIPDLALELPVETMGWVVTEQNGQRTTTWIVPSDAIGWHANSVGAGGAGNLILSGQQAKGSALFAPLALGDITVGQELVVTDVNGEQFRYRVTEVSDPIPVLGATDEDNTLARSYLQPSESPILTMMTGWPDFTTTHRIFAVAEYIAKVGSAP